MHKPDVVIVAAARTPLGAFQGALASVAAPRLGAVAIKAALERAGVKPEQVDEVYMGCVLQAGLGQAPARQAALGAGLPSAVPCTTVNKVCGSGLKAVMLAAQAIQTGESEVVVAGGMESMSNVPYYLTKARAGYRMGNGELVDGMIKDGLWDVYNDFHMGSAGELCAKSEQISRSAQDEFALESTRRAQAAQASGAFKAEIAAVELPGKAGPTLVTEDEGPKNARPEKIPTLKPVFAKDGTITAANASSINDGAAAVILSSRERAEKEGWPVLATIRGFASAARKPEEFTIAPADAIKRVLSRLELSTGDIDAYEINEAFAVVAIANNTRLGLDPAKVNKRGGAVALGHPIGASGTRILVTLLHILKDENLKRGLASLCIGGGEAVALVVER
jgi:acetyl-CoA C-acetyltransferase